MKNLFLVLGVLVSLSTAAQKQADTTFTPIPDWKLIETPATVGWQKGIALVESDDFQSRQAAFAKLNGIVAVKVWVKNGWEVWDEKKKTKLDPEKIWGYKVRSW